MNIEYDLELFHRTKDNLAPPELKKIHALGKSPVLSVTPPGSSEPIILAETGYICQYLSEHFGQGTTMLPPKFKKGQEGRLGGETEEWLRWQYFLHYAEGSLMPLFVLSLIMGLFKSPRVPFFIRPITGVAANQVMAAFVLPNLKTHMAYLEQKLETSGGDYLCGPNLTAADMIVSFGFMMAKDGLSSMGRWDSDPATGFPRLFAWLGRLEEHPGYKKSVEKIQAIDPSYGIKF